MLPYPGRYESHESWMRRCDDYERDRRNYFKSISAGRGSQKMDGYIYPEISNERCSFVVLPCYSRKNQLELYFSWSNPRTEKYKGYCTGHSTCSSYNYTMVFKPLYEFVKNNWKRGMSSNDFNKLVEKYETI